MIFELLACTMYVWCTYSYTVCIEIFAGTIHQSPKLFVFQIFNCRQTYEVHVHKSFSTTYDSNVYSISVCVCCVCACVCVCLSTVPVLGLRAWQSIYTYVHGAHVKLGFSPVCFFLHSLFPLLHSFPPPTHSSFTLLSFSFFSFLFCMCTSLLPCLYTHPP